MFGPNFSGAPPIYCNQHRYATALASIFLVMSEGGPALAKIFPFAILLSITVGIVNT